MKTPFTFCAWGLAPNRHLEPLWDEGFRSGVLRHVFYSRETLDWQQLGTPPRRRPLDQETVLRGRLKHVRDLVRRSGADGHLMVAISSRLSRAVMQECRASGRPFFLIAEALRRRPRHSVRRIVREFLFSRALKGVGGVFALSRFGALAFEEIGVTRDRIFPGAYPMPLPARRYECKSAPALVYCGRFIPCKALDLLCDGVRRCAQELPGVTLDVIGEGPEGGHFDRLAEHGVPVRRHGRVESAQAVKLISEAAVLLLTTRGFEGWGYVVNEALANGVPVVVSDICGAQEVVIPGRNGIVFRESDPVSLAAGIKRAVALHEQGASEACFSDLQTALSPQSVVSYMADVMRLASQGMSGEKVVPWHHAIDLHGGNSETRWWRSWKAGSDPQSEADRESSLEVSGA